MKTANSKRYHLDEIDWVQIGKHALGVFGPATALFLADFFDKIDWGMWTPVIAASVTMGLDWFRKVVRDNSDSDPKGLK